MIYEYEVFSDACEIKDCEKILAKLYNSLSLSGWEIHKQTISVDRSKQFPVFYCIIFRKLKSSDEKPPIPWVGEY